MTGDQNYNELYPMDLSKLYDEKFLNKLTVRPGSVVYTDTMTTTGTGNIVNWKKFGTISDKDYQEATALDVRRQTKIFAHFAKMFCQRFTQWELVPDATDPFHKVSLRHMHKPYRIESGYPSNEVRLYGGPLTHAEIGLDHSTVPFQNFYGWALGIEDVPDFVRE